MKTHMNEPITMFKKQFNFLSITVPPSKIPIYPIKKTGISHFFILGAISSTTVTRKYIPYSNQVIVLFQGKLFSGWFNANTINTIATINIITPIILDILFFM